MNIHACYCPLPTLIRQYWQYKFLKMCAWFSQHCRIQHASSVVTLCIVWIRKWSQYEQSRVCEEGSKWRSKSVSQCDYPFLPFLFCFSFDVCQPVGVQANTMHESCIRLSEPKKHPTFCWMSQVFCYFLRAGDCGSALFCLQCVVGANSSYTSSCLMSLPRWCHQPKESAQKDYYTLVRLTNLKQLQMQPFKHPCTLWGIHLQDI